MLDKLLNAFSNLTKAKEEEVKQPEQQEEENEPLIVEEKAPEDALDPVLVSQWESELEKFVYDAELAKDLAPVFVKLLNAEGFDKVIELLETKEKQIEAISTGSQKQQTSPEQKQEAKEAKPQTATDILKARYSL